MAHTSITIVLELDHTTDCPTGSARVPGGPCRQFHGWLGLSEAIDALTRTREGVPSADTSDGEGDT